MAASREQTHSMSGAALMPTMRVDSVRGRSRLRVEVEALLDAATRYQCHLAWAWNEWKRG